MTTRRTFAAGGGATLNFGVTDAIFRPLADCQELAARESDLQTARNDALLAVALAYFDVQQARGTLAGTLDAVAKAEVLARKTAGLAKGLVAEIEVDRARALLFDLQQQVAASRANWRITSARLTRVLRLNPGAVVVPMEPPHLQIALISPGFRVADLVPVGLTNRPELASQHALVQASLERVRQERAPPISSQFGDARAKRARRLLSTAASLAADPMTARNSMAAGSTWSWEPFGRSTTWARATGL